jgi:hypothetical protein
VFTHQGSIKDLSIFGQEDWSVRELKHQFNSGFYERLALSRNKAEIRQLAKEGQHISNPKTGSKSPMFWSFLVWMKNRNTPKPIWSRQLLISWSIFSWSWARVSFFEAHQKRFTSKDYLWETSDNF